jgi:3-oxoacyl-[acyl-carrier-protein] synthase II
MQNRKLAILGMGFISAAGNNFEALGKTFSADSAPYAQDKNGLYFPIPQAIRPTVEESVQSIHNGQRLDPTVKLAATATLDCLKNLSIGSSEKVLVNIGSSRGASHTWETEFGHFMESGKSSPKASPYSTPGNISSNIATLLSRQSIVVDHSVTCGSGLQAIANAAAWIRSGMAGIAIAGGAEAPLTPFTRSQMQALKITASTASNFPAKPLASEKIKTGMVLGEGAAVFALGDANRYMDAQFYVNGIGMANERGDSPSGITGEGKALYESMKAALSDAGIEKPDLIIMHAPGTEKGDSAELNAIQHLFGDDSPRLFSNKHIMGHTLGASGTLSIVTACYILMNNAVPNLPYPAFGQNFESGDIKSVMINATGFGGNAISIIVSKSN